MRKFSLNILLFLFLAAESGAQQKYWIYFKDKTAVTDAAPEIRKDFCDLPVSVLYKDSLKVLGYEIIQQSRWLNAITVTLEESQQKALGHLSFIEAIVPVNDDLRILSYDNDKANIVRALKQMKADTLIELGLDGNGVKIGIIDGGFLKADEEQTLKPLIRQVAGYRNFIERDSDQPYINNEYNDDHGTDVWKLIGGYDDKNYYGLASAATYYLARTDQGDKEYRGEEDHWIAALEWMYEHGVRLVNSSLGYSDGYDDPTENYTPEHVDGSSSAITRAATIAAKQKGMILVMAAGNDGGTAFEVINIPADADGVIAVGATGFERWSKQRYSSIGPADLLYVKPEIACYALRGTSFSAPVVTGMIAGILEAHPGLTNKEIMTLLKKSSHLYPYPNNYLGYGVPDAGRILRLLHDPKFTRSGKKSIIAKGDYVTLKVSATNVVLFHKKNKTEVIEQELGRSKKGILTVRRAKNAKFTTVATPDAVYEVVWEGL